MPLEDLQLSSTYFVIVQTSTQNSNLSLSVYFQIP
jgi:hypothetical protein